MRSALQEACDAASAEPFDIEMVVKLNPSYEGGGASSYLTGGSADSTKTSGSSASPAVESTYLRGHAAGGYVSGGPQLSWLAEEGYGEFIIPTNPSRRRRALELYEQAGAALGVSAHASGGYVGGSLDNETIESDYAIEPYDYESAGNGSNTSNVGMVQVSVDMSPEFVIQIGGGQDEEKIMTVIRKHMSEMADELGGEIAGKLKEVFSNMPLKEA